MITPSMFARLSRKTYCEPKSGRIIHVAIRDKTNPADNIILCLEDYMIQIRPVSDLRNKFTEIEEIVTSTQSPVFLTKNGYGSMVVMSLKAYENMTNNIEAKLDEADNYAEVSDVRLSHDEVFGKLRNKIRK